MLAAQSGVVCYRLKAARLNTFTVRFRPRDESSRPSFSYHHDQRKREGLDNLTLRHRRKLSIDISVVQSGLDSWNCQTLPVPRQSRGFSRDSNYSMSSGRCFDVSLA